MKSNIVNCAYYFVYLFKTKHNDIDSTIMKLKLYKLVFLTNAYYLALNNKPMFEENWEYDFYGPKTKKMSEEFDWHGAMDISIMFEKDELEEKIGNIDANDKIYLEYIYKIFGNYSSFDFMIFTNLEGIHNRHKDEFDWEESLSLNQIKNWFTKTYPYLILN